MAEKISLRCLLFGHRFVEIIDDMKGTAKAVRMCEHCPRKETYIYDFDKQDYVWVRGCYLNFTNEFWVVASTRACFQDRAEELQRDYKGCIVRWLDYTEARRLRHKTHWPDIRFAADWAESDVLPELANYFLYGYV